MSPSGRVVIHLASSKEMEDATRRTCSMCQRLFDRDQALLKIVEKNGVDLYAAPYNVRACEEHAAELIKAGAVLIQPAMRGEATTSVASVSPESSGHTSNREKREDAPASPRTPSTTRKKLDW